MSRRGFTFAEILAAMIFIAILVPVAVQGVMIANRAGVVAQRKRQAAELANKCLTDLILTDQWRQQPTQSGDFGDDWPNFHWVSSVEPWQEDAAMQAITVTVTFQAQERNYQVALTTLAPADEGTATSSSSTQLGVTTAK